MFRELLVFLYLINIKFWFFIFNLLPLREKTTFVSSFGDNIYYTWQKVIELTEHKTVILNQNGLKNNIENNDRTVIRTFHLLQRPFSFISGIYHLATSKVIFIDNYFGFLSATNFRDQVRCIQLWHANGAVKKFGLEDPSIQFRSENAYKRFKKVYQRFHYVAVGSEKMEGIFKEAFDVNDESFIRTGIPRTDIFYDRKLKIVRLNRLKTILIYLMTKRLFYMHRHLEIHN